jgi:hypothetical protein
LLETARELGVAIVAYSPLGRGLLTGAYKSRVRDAGRSIQCYFDVASTIIALSFTFYSFGDMRRDSQRIEYDYSGRVVAE